METSKEEFEIVLQRIKSNSEQWNKICLAIAPREIELWQEYQQLLKMVKKQFFYPIMAAVFCSKRLPIPMDARDIVLKMLAEEKDADKVESFIKDMIESIVED